MPTGSGDSSAPCSSFKPFSARPSTHTAPSLPSASGSSETKPCSVCVPSVCGTTARPHVFPPSFERATFTSYAYVPAPLFTSQCAASDPSASATTDGKSAQLTNQLSPSATVRASDHPEGSRDAKRSAYVCSPLLSTQLRMTRPSVPVNSSGSRLSAPAGESASRTAGAACGPGVARDRGAFDAFRSHPAKRRVVARTRGAYV